MSNTISTIAIILWAIVVVAIHSIIWWNIKDEYNGVKQKQPESLLTLHTSSLNKLKSLYAKYKCSKMLRMAYCLL
jgi:hypothetical protein